MEQNESSIPIEILESPNDSAGMREEKHYQEHLMNSGHSPVYPVRMRLQKVPVSEINWLKIKRKKEEILSFTKGIDSTDTLEGLRFKDDIFYWEPSKTDPQNEIVTLTKYSGFYFDDKQTTPHEEEDKTEDSPFDETKLSVSLPKSYVMILYKGENVTLFSPKFSSDGFERLSKSNNAAIESRPEYSELRQLNQFLRDNFGKLQEEGRLKFFSKGDIPASVTVEDDVDIDMVINTTKYLSDYNNNHDDQEGEDIPEKYRDKTFKVLIRTPVSSLKECIQSGIWGEPSSLTNYFTVPTIGPILYRDWTKDPQKIGAIPFGTIINVTTKAGPKLVSVVRGAPAYIPKIAQGAGKLIGKVPNLFKSGLKTTGKNAAPIITAGGAITGGFLAGRTPKK